MTTESEREQAQARGQVHGQAHGQARGPLQGQPHPLPAAGETVAASGQVDVTEPVTAERVRALAEGTGVGAIMSRQVVCLAPEADVHAVTEMFLDRDFSSAPVVDEHWQPLAVVSKTDLLRFFSTGRPLRDSLRAAGCLQGPTATATTATTAATTAEQGCAMLLASPGQVEAPIQRPEGGDVQVADVTVPYVLSLHEDAPISVAAALMAYEGVHRLPIVAASGQVVGVVSTLDIVRWLAEATGLGPEALG